MLLERASHRMLVVVAIALLASTIAIAKHAPRREVHGTVVPGSLVRSSGWAIFTLAKDGERWRVRVDGLVPDTLCEGRSVLVKGVLRGDLLEADDVIAKCPTKYETAQGRRCGGSVMLVK